MVGKTGILGYYTNVGGTTDLPTDKLPWATVTTHLPGNDGQVKFWTTSTGAIVRVLHGWKTQMPIVIGVLRVTKSSDTRTKQRLLLQVKI